MNFVTVCAQLREDPREVYTSATSTAVRCSVTLPPYNGKKAPTEIELTVYGQQQGERFRSLKKGTGVYIHGAKLQYDLETRTFSLHGGVVTPVNVEQFPILNTVILSGRCVKDIDPQDTRQCKTTASYMITNQTLSVVTKRNESNLFNFYAINGFDDRFKPAELLANYTHKGTGLTIEARIITDSWTDKDSKERRTQTKLQLVNMTLAPKSQGASKPVEPKANVAAPSNVTSLWGGRTGEPEEQEAPSSPHQAAIAGDPWKVEVGVGERGGLPDLPGSYGPAPVDDENAPF